MGARSQAGWYYYYWHYCTLWVFAQSDCVCVYLLAVGQACISSWISSRQTCLIYVGNNSAFFIRDGDACAHIGDSDVLCGLLSSTCTEKEEERRVISLTAEKRRARATRTPTHAPNHICICICFPSIHGGQQRPKTDHLGCVWGFGALVHLPPPPSKSARCEWGD